MIRLLILIATPILLVAAPACEDGGGVDSPDPGTVAARDGGDADDPASELCLEVSFASVDIEQSACEGADCAWKASIDSSGTIYVRHRGNVSVCEGQSDRGLTELAAHAVRAETIAELRKDCTPPVTDVTYTISLQIAPKVFVVNNNPSCSEGFVEELRQKVRAMADACEASQR